MSEISDAFLAKSRESLVGATTELIGGRYNNAANRSYYSAYQAAVVALDRAGIRPEGAQEQWSHRFVQAKFPELINRRKLYANTHRDTLSQLISLRITADYKLVTVSETQARRAVAKASSFVAMISDQERNGA